MAAAAVRVWWKDLCLIGTDDDGDESSSMCDGDAWRGETAVYLLLILAKIVGIASGWWKAVATDIPDKTELEHHRSTESFWVINFAN